MDGWPWTDAGMKQPMVGYAQIFIGFFLTVVGYLVLIYPSLASWTAPGKVVMSLPTAIGWFYSVIIVWLTTVLLTDLWPYSYFQNPSRKGPCRILRQLRAGHRSLLHSAGSAEECPDTGGCTGENRSGNQPLACPARCLDCSSGAPLGIVLRQCAYLPEPGNEPDCKSRYCLGLGIGAFVVYMRWFAMDVLHEAAIVPGFGGDPLTWVDLLNLFF